MFRYKYQIGDIVSGVPHELTQKNRPETHLIIDYDILRYLNNDLPVYVTVHMESGNIKRVGRNYIDLLEKVG